MSAKPSIWSWSSQSAMTRRFRVLKSGAQGWSYAISTHNQPVPSGVSGSNGASISTNFLTEVACLPIQAHHPPQACEGVYRNRNALGEMKTKSGFRWLPFLRRGVIILGGQGEARAPIKVILPQFSHANASRVHGSFSSQQPPSAGSQTGSVMRAVSSSVNCFASVPSAFMIQICSFAPI